MTNMPETFTLTVTPQECDVVLAAIQQAPIPYVTASPLLSKLVEQVRAQQKEPANEPVNEPKEPTI